MHGPSLAAVTRSRSTPGFFAYSACVQVDAARRVTQAQKRSTGGTICASGKDFDCVSKYLRASARLGVPVALLFLLVGVLAGTEGFGGIPFDDYAQVALVTVGHTIGDDFKPAVRKPLDDIVHRERW